VPLEEDQNASAAWIRAVSRASGIEGVHTGMENVLKEVLNVVDGGVFGKSESYHAQLLESVLELSAVEFSMDLEAVYSDVPFDKTGLA
jgi:hypothetical protein